MFGHLLEAAGDDPKSGFGEAFGGHVAAGDGPFVVLFGEHGADEADHGVAVGEDPDDVGAAAEFVVERSASIVLLTTAFFLSSSSQGPQRG